ncbi:heavy metal-responsive transcriptional regulator [Ancylothrix sp. C2]|uniref:heavy metal-responsive transcriptional regulator n=1 Tax=Ancylothrix sp. D3o TaxID=2953691 RepID=UPI0021BB6D1B|nr:heavy metal-responsive transcriptional regulator [Ancylothrix sp. D3o]MCT7948796.1 heavy metal-responsive transcriptional regulator [Ancylothrix sp. D3o]
MLTGKITQEMTGQDQLLKIGEVAAITHLPVKTIRYYEEIGLLAPNVERSKSGYRLFKIEVINRLGFIKRAQSLGLSLSEIQEILNIYQNGELPCGEMKQHLLAKVDAINEQIAALEGLKQELQGLLGRWEEEPPADRISQTICPNIQL